MVPTRNSATATAIHSHWPEASEVRERESHAYMHAPKVATCIPYAMLCRNRAVSWASAMGNAMSLGRIARGRYLVAMRLKTACPYRTPFVILMDTASSSRSIFRGDTRMRKRVARILLMHGRRCFDESIRTLSNTLYCRSQLIVAGWTHIIAPVHWFVC